MTGEPREGDACAGAPTERPDPGRADLDTLACADLVALVFDADRAAFDACRDAASDLARAVEIAAAALAGGGRMVYVGAGTSGRLGVLDAAELPPTFGIEPGRVAAILAGGPGAVFRAAEGAEDDAQDGAAQIREAGLGAGDVVVGITASGRTPFTLAALAEAARAGAATVALVASPVEAGFPAGVVVHLSVGPELLAGSTRMKAGTATKMALGALSLGVMARLGKVYGGRMVDLRTGSEKLRRRARGLVAEICGVDAAAAASLLAAAGGSVKTAAAMGRLGVARAEAERRLAAASGRLREVIGDPRS